MSFLNKLKVFFAGAFVSRSATILSEGIQITVMSRAFTASRTMWYLSRMCLALLWMVCDSASLIQGWLSS